MSNKDEFMQLVIDSHLVSADALEKARLALERLAEKGGEGDIKQMLVEEGLLTEDQVRRLSAGAGKVIPTCFRCLRRSIFEADGFTGTYLCQHCHEAVSFEDHTAGLGEELLPNPPARVVDKIVEKLVIKAGMSAQRVGKLKEDRKKMVPRPTLVQMVKIQGMVNESQMLQLKGKAEAVFRKKIKDWSSLQEDYELACFLCRLRVVSQKVLSEVLQKQLENALNGNYQALRETLRRKGELTDYQITEFLPNQFDRRSRRMELLAAVAGALSAEEDGIEESEWEDSLVEIGMESEGEALNVISLDEEPAPDPNLSPREQEQRKLFSSFYEKELKDIKSAKDLKGKRNK